MGIINKSQTTLPQKGFTLVELVVVIVVLGVVSISFSGIFRSTIDIFNAVNERENLVREGSFLVERFNRELSRAVPNSVRISASANVHCIEFVAMNWNGIYLSLPLAGQTSNTANLITLSDSLGNMYVPAVGESAIVYPTDASHVYDASLGYRRTVNSCSDDGDGDCATDDDSDSVIQLTLNDGFAQTSPSNRIYFADTAISYCMRNQQMFRHTSAINTTQPLYTSGGNLMAQNLVNQLAANTNGEQSPFKRIAASLQRNAATRSLFIFGREEDERITFMQEVQVPNAP